MPKLNPETLNQYMADFTNDRQAERQYVEQYRAFFDSFFKLDTILGQYADPSRSGPLQPDEISNLQSAYEDVLIKANQFRSAASESDLSKQPELEGRITRIGSFSEDVSEDMAGLSDLAAEMEKGTAGAFDAAGSDTISVAAQLANQLETPIRGDETERAAASTIPFVKEDDPLNIASFAQMDSSNVIAQNEDLQISDALSGNAEQNPGMFHAEPHSGNLVSQAEQPENGQADIKSVENELFFKKIAALSDEDIDQFMTEYLKDSAENVQIKARNDRMLQEIVEHPSDEAYNILAAKVLNARNLLSDVLNNSKVVGNKAQIVREAIADMLILQIVDDTRRKNDPQNKAENAIGNANPYQYRQLKTAVNEIPSVKEDLKRINKLVIKEFLLDNKAKKVVAKIPVDQRLTFVKKAMDIMKPVAEVKKPDAKTIAPAQKGPSLP